MDPDEFRSSQLAHWDEQAAGWGRARELQRAVGAPASHWMVERIAPQPGQTILELACGEADTGLLAAELVAPSGRLIASDLSPAMLELARERAGQLGLDNVEFRELSAEWIDLPTASVDAILCRWGFMLVLDPATALGESRRVLKPGGRIALAAWSALEENPWAPVGVLREHGLAPPPAPGAPGPFAFADRGRIVELLLGAGFSEIEVDTLDLSFEFPDDDALWGMLLDCSGNFRKAFEGLDADAADRLRAAVVAANEPYRTAAGGYRVPGRTHVAAAGA